MLRAVALLLLPLLAVAQERSPSSILIRDAVIVDGTGSAGRKGDVRIRGARIVEIGALQPTEGERVVDARGLTLAPGFIDTHSHHDRGLAAAPDALAAVSQGITTIVVGQDGGSAFPLESAFAELERQPAAVNVASYVGHGTLRREVLGGDFKRAATPAEITRMEELARAEMQAGALGLSTGLEYDPGIYSTRAEVVAVARAVASMGGRYVSHLRSEDRELYAAVEEALDIGRQTGMPVQISHIKLAMRGLWGQADTLLQVLDRARAAGVNVTADVYPYTYWQSTMTVLFPKRDFKDRREAEFVLDQLVAPEGLLITGFEQRPEYVGKTIADIAKQRGTDPATTVLALIEEAGGRGPGVVATSMAERDVERLIQWRFANICSDGALSGGHPRGFGAFPRVLGRYVRERKVLPLEEAIRKMTSFSAANAGVTDRGAIAPGQFADLVLFDPATVTDRATTANSKALSTGIRTVWVNGEPVFENGVATGRRPGRAIRRTATR